MAVTIIVGTEKGAFICRSEDHQTWQVEEPQFKGWKATAACRSAEGGYLLATASRVYGAALHRSVDLKEWRQIENGPAYPEGGERKLAQIWALHAAPGRLYAGVERAGLFYSDDDGGSWHPVAALNDHPTSDAWFPGAGGLCAHSILTEGDRIWVGISAVGVWRSDDRGASWTPKNEGIHCVIEDKVHKEIGFCVHGLAKPPGDAETIWRQDHTGMYKSTNGGDTWQESQEGLPSWFGFPVAHDPSSNRLFAFPMESDEYRMPVNGEFRVYRSDDGGAHWEACGEGLPNHRCYGGVLRGAMSVDGAGGVYVGTTDGAIFASANGGDTWQRLPVTCPRILCVEAFS